jgi:methyl-accepting chemotaxis protein
MHIRDWKIENRLRLGFGVILTIVGISIAVTAISLKGIGESSRQIKDYSLPYTIIADELAFDTVQVQQYLTDVSATHNTDGYKEAEEAAKHFLTGLAKFETKFARDKDEKSLQSIREMRTDFATYYELGKKMANAYLTQGIVEGNVMMENFDKSSEVIAAKVKAFRIRQVKDADLLVGGVNRTVVNLYSTFLAVGLIVLLVGMVVSFLISRSITKPVQEAVCVINRITQGDLSVKIAYQSKDEIGSLGLNINLMVDDINEVFSSVIAAAKDLTAAGKDLHGTSVKVSGSIRSVADQSSAIAADSEEMAQTSGSIALNCGVAVQSSAQANKSVQKSSEIIEGTVQGLRRVSEKVNLSAASVTNLGTRSEEIGEIISTIEDIADQTNLLALNAAIEAARAGEQGRGFAVVADEVRALATRTTNATKDIGQLINAIQREIKDAVAGMKDGVEEATRGTEEAAQSGAAMQEILEQLATITSQIGMIARAADEQSATTGDVSRNMQQISQEVEATADGMYATSAASSQLAQIAANLQGKVKRFKLAA